jgi:SAM-dependent methyltransferase
MLIDAQNALDSGLKIFEYEIIDAQQIPYQDSSFDIVIANYMLYHVPDRKKAISEICRVLKTDGTFYATAFGLKNMNELTDLVFNYHNKVYNPLQSLALEFGLENGKKQLIEYFEDVKIMKYDNYLEVTEAEPLVNFVLSSSNVIQDDEIDDFTYYIADIIQKLGKIKISKDAGMFIAENPK